MAWRLYNAKDKPETDALHARMEARLGEELDLPQLDERPVLIAIVREHKGVITNAIYLEAVAEVGTMGECALPRKEWARAAALLQQTCAAYNIRIARAFVPRQALADQPHEREWSGKKFKEKPIGRILKYLGFGRENVSKLVPFSKWLAPRKPNG